MGTVDLANKISEIRKIIVIKGIMHHIIFFYTDYYHFECYLLYLPLFHLDTIHTRLITPQSKICRFS